MGSEGKARAPWRGRPGRSGGCGARPGRNSAWPRSVWWPGEGSGLRLAGDRLGSVDLTSRIVIKENVF